MRNLLCTPWHTDIFPIIPGDTDYRIFAEDYGNIPGLDIIFLLGGYFYHTSFDTIDRIIPGSIQARGENLFRLIKAFSSSSNLQNAKEFAGNRTTDDRAVFFDYLTWFMIFYSGKEALIFHSLPLATFIAVPFFLSYPDFGISNWFVISCNLIAGTLYQLFRVLLAIIFPVMFAITRLLVSGHAMIWFTHPWLAFLMFVPSSLIGLLLPKFILDNIRFLELSDKCISDEVCFWGAFGYYALFTLAYQVAGLRGGFFTFMLSVFMIISRISCGLVSRGVKHISFKRVAGYIVPSLPVLLFASHFGIFLIQFLIEKMGMMGSLPQPYGYFVPDIIVAAAVGLVTGWCMGPLLPVVSSWLARPSILLGLLHFSVAAMALSSQLFPYSTSAPKRVVLQHTYLTADASSLLDSRYEFSVVDANSLYFLFKHSPEAANLLHISPTFSPETSSPSAPSSWTALYPISYLFGGSLKFPPKGVDDVFEHYSHLPHLFRHNQTSMSSTGFRKVYLEFSLGSLEEVWVTVLNITGPLSNWSFADYHVPAPDSLSGGPPSYICRLSGRSQENWTFWLEANSSTDLRVDVAVVDRYLAEETKKLKSLFPNWVDVVTYSSYMSTYFF